MNPHEIRRMTISLQQHIYKKIYALAPDNVSAWVRRAIDKALDATKKKRG